MRRDGQCNGGRLEREGMAAFNNVCEEDVWHGGVHMEGAQKPKKKVKNLEKKEHIN